MKSLRRYYPGSHIHMLQIAEEDCDHYCLDNSCNWLLVLWDPHFDQLFARHTANDPTVEWGTTTRCTTNDEEMGELTASPAAPTDVLSFAEGMDLGEDNPPHPPSPSPLSTPLSSTYSHTPVSGTVDFFSFLMLYTTSELMYICMHIVYLSMGGLLSWIYMYSWM